MCPRRARLCDGRGENQAGMIHLSSPFTQSVLSFYRVGTDSSDPRFSIFNIHILTLTRKPFESISTGVGMREFGQSRPFTRTRIDLIVNGQLVPYFCISSIFLCKS
jgi:hypothetical protein